MKTIALHLPKVLFALVLLALAAPAGGQNSLVRQYPVLSGDTVLVRTDNSTFVTCCNTTGWRSCFVVDDGTTCRRFFTTLAPSGIHITDSGYVVYDMQLVNGVCWFAGYKWFDTGLPFYTLDGQAYNLVTYKAVIGRFNTADVLNGSGNYGIIEVSGLHHIERLAVIGSNATAIGVRPNGTRQLVELALDTSGYSYLLSIENSSMSQEVFMDVVAAGNKAVVLSRFNASGNPWYHRDYFGLRYGSAGNLYGTSNNIRCYDVYTAMLWCTSFTAVHPIRLAATNNGDGVVVAYIALNDEETNPLLNKFVLFHVASENASTTDVIFNLNDEYQYTEIADIRFNKPVFNNTNMALLLRDGSGNSVLRFPKLTFPLSNTLYEDVLFINNLRINSVAPYQTGLTNLHLSAAGHYNGTTPYLAGIVEKNIYSLDFTQNCFSFGNGNLTLYKNIPSKAENFDYPLVVSTVSAAVTFKNHSYSSASLSKTNTCINGN